MNANEIKVLSRHSSLRSAVDAAYALGTMGNTVAGLDLSYNQAIADAEIRNIDKGSPNHAQLPIAPCDLALVCLVAGKIELYHLTRCDIAILNKFSPFISCLNDSPLRIIRDKGETLEIIEGVQFSKTRIGRKVIRDMQKSIPELYAF